MALTSLGRVVLDPDVAAHLVTALSGYRRALRSAGRPVPPSVEAIIDFEARVVRNGQSLGSGRAAGDTPTVDHAGPLTLAEAAALVGTSVKTIRRRIDDGRLAARRVGGRVLVEPSALLDYLEAS